MAISSAPPAQLSPIDDLLARHFPLLPRTRPSCRPLPSRVAHVEQLVRRAAHAPANALLRAAEAHNFAALIASDCGMADLARTLCLRQYAAIRTTTPVGVAAAKLALQPLVNLGRLHTRAGDGDAAYQVFQTLFDTVRGRGEADIDGVRIDARTLVVDADHAELTQWMWVTLLADGSRALARAGRWHEARDAAAAHQGIGERLFDGRQVAIIDASSRAAAHARAMLEATPTPTDWERAVAACLDVACHARSGQLTAGHVTAAASTYHRAVRGDVDGVFAARLGLTIAALTGDHPDAAAVATHVEHAATDADDAYVARDVLAAASTVPLTAETVRVLTNAVQHAGLDAGSLPGPLLTRLTEAANTAEQIIAATAAAEAS
jgi:hypothetical protein